MQGLGLRDNQLTSLPEEIEALSQLKKLYLSYNQLTSLPEGIGALSQLEELGLSYNRLMSLPEGIGALLRLKELYLNSNKLKTFPKGIGGLSQLEGLGLSDNQFTSLPEGIGALSQLKKLYIENNQLTSLPRSVENLQNIVLLDLRDNPLIDYGEGNTLGWRELRARFGDKVVLPQDAIRGPERIISENEVYKKLAASPLHWDVGKLREIVMDPIPYHKLEGKDIIDIWMKELLKYVTDEAKDERDMESYIKTIYGMDPDAFKGWNMYEKSISATKDLIEAIFVKLKDNAFDAEAYVPEICEAIEYCPDRQIACLNMVYSALYSKKNTASFEYFTENEIATLKNYIFDMVVTPGTGTQNVHVQNFWKHKLREKLGFSIKYKPGTETYGQDMFGGHVGNALYTFYKKFTPDYMITQLMDEINSRNNRLSDAGSFFVERLGDTEYMNRVFAFENEENERDLVPNGIKKEGVEDILVKMGILERNTQSVGRPRRKNITWRSRLRTLLSRMFMFR